MSFSQAVEDDPDPVGELDGLPETGVPRHTNGLCTMSGMFSPGGVCLAMINAPVHRLTYTSDYTEPLRSLGVIRVTHVEAEGRGAARSLAEIAGSRRRVRLAQSAGVDVGLYHPAVAVRVHPHRLDARAPRRPDAYGRRQTQAVGARGKTIVCVIMSWMLRHRAMARARPH